MGVLAIVTVRGGGAKTFHPLKEGGLGSQKVSDPRFSHFVAPPPPSPRNYRPVPNCYFTLTFTISIFVKFVNHCPELVVCHVLTKFSEKKRSTRQSMCLFIKGTCNYLAQFQNILEDPKNSKRGKTLCVCEHDSIETNRKSMI